MKKLIKGVRVKQLKIHADSRGMLAEILRSDEQLFRKFGQVYFTTALPGVVKAWHYHLKQTDYFTCVHGTVRLVLHYGDEFNEFVIGIRNPLLVAIPPRVLHGFQNLGTEECVMVNIPTEPYRRTSPDEYRLSWNSVAFNWNERNK